jgi:WD40 repeat protein
VAFSPDGQRLVSSCQDGTIKLWNAVTGREERTITGHSGPAFGLAFSPDGTRLAATGDIPHASGTAFVAGEVRVWDAATGQEVLVLRGHTATILGVAFSPDGRRLVTASRDARVKVWDTALGQETFTLTGHTGPVTSVAFSADGQRIASASLDGTVKLWDAAPAGERPGP